MIRKIAYILFVSFLFGCIDEYKLPQDITNNYQEELVIEGRILSGEESVFYVTRTLPLSSGLDVSYISDADIFIIGQNGYRSPKAIYTDENKYIINTGKLELDAMYAVEVYVDGETYQSEFQPLQTSPDIDNVSYKECEDQTISFHVTTYGNEDSSRYYMWTYEEDWEFHADLNMFQTNGILFYNENTYPVSELGSNPYYYCWGQQQSYEIKIYTTKELSSNEVREYELQRIGLDDIRISYIYSILVKQWCLTEEAYEYFRLMKLYTEDSGGLFMPMPNDVRGNVLCISNPEVNVRGFVIASEVKEKRMFLYEADLKLGHSVYENCHWSTPPLNQANWQKSWMDQIMYGGAVSIGELPTINETSILYSKECVDCRNTKGASKKRPDFWPNNHK